MISYIIIFKYLIKFILSLIGISPKFFRGFPRNLFLVTSQNCSSFEPSKEHIYYSRILMHKRMEMSFFGGVTIGDTHVINSSVLFSSLRRRCSSSSILGLMWNGIFRFVIVTGRTGSSKWSLTCTFFSFPIPFVRPGYSSSHFELILFTMFPSPNS